MSTRRRICVSGLLALGLGLGLACQERLTDLDEPEGRKWCVALTGAWIVDAEGEIVDGITDENNDTLFVCHCLTLDEGLSGDWDAQVNDEAYELCLTHAERMGYPDPADHTCDDRYAENSWGESFGILPQHREVVCDVDGGEAPEGCAVE